LVSEKQKYFCKWGWTGQKHKSSLICPSGNRIEPKAEFFLSVIPGRANGSVLTGRANARVMKGFAMSQESKTTTGSKR
jgi:hypothetical protein